MMKYYFNLFLIIAISIVHLECSSPKKHQQNNKQLTQDSKKVYKTKNLIITQISANAFIHTSFLQTHDFGYVPCNGLVIRDQNETIIFDTPTNDKSAKELINWITIKLNCKINAVIPTHFHDDCVGGYKAFENKNITAYAFIKTIEIAKINNIVVPKISFNDSLILTLGNEKTILKFFGEGHTKDNIVAYYPKEKILFGGCLIKELNASKGYLGDANTTDWSSTVQKIKTEYPDVKIVIPGHGKHGNSALLDYTIHLFKNNE